MFGRRGVLVLLLTGGVVLPVITGSSCPPPSDPFYLAVTPNRLTVGTDIPACTPGFVCVSIVNTACINAEVSLFVHDGFDPLIQYPAGYDVSCCASTTTNQQCACPRPGYQVGELQLTRPELFDAVNLRAIQGSNSRILQPRESVLIQIQEGDIKSFGVLLGRQGTDVLNSPEISDGPRYRCTMVPIPTPSQSAIPYERSPEDVPSGETFQFVIYDQSNCALPGLAQFATRTGTSAAGGCPAISTTP